MSDNLVPDGEALPADREQAMREGLCVVVSTGSYRVLCYPDRATLRSVSRTRSSSFIPPDVQLPRRSGLDTTALTRRRLAS
jgi:FixJ family two-component response regulator